MLDDKTISEGFRRFGLLLQREAAHQIILAALDVEERDDLRAYHWELSIHHVTRLAELAIELGAILEEKGPVLLLNGIYPPRGPGDPGGESCPGDRERQSAN